MGMVVVLVARSAGGVQVEPESLRALAALGITSLALASDDESDGLVLEGWAFDADGSTAAVLAALELSEHRPRVLRPVTLMTIPPA